MHEFLIYSVWLGLAIVAVVNLVFCWWIRGEHQRKTTAGYKALQAGDLEGAERHFRKALAAALRHRRPARGWLSSSYVNLGQVCRQLGREEDALRLFSAAAECAPAAENGIEDRAALAFSSAAELLERAGAWEESVAFRQASLERLKISAGAETQKAAEAWDRLSVGLYQVQRFGDAAAAGQECLRIWAAIGQSRAEHVDAVVHAAQALWSSGDRGRAEQMYRGLIAELTRPGQESPDSLAAVWTDLGLRMREAGRRQEALRCLETALELRTNVTIANPEAVAVGLSHVAVALLDDEQPERSEEFARDAVAILREAPGALLAVALDTLGQALAAQRNDADALAAFEEACALLENAAEHRDKLVEFARRRAEVLKRMGRGRDASESQWRATRLSLGAPNRYRAILQERSAPNPELFHPSGSTTIAASQRRSERHRLAVRVVTVAALSAGFWALIAAGCVLVAAQIWRSIDTGNPIGMLLWPAALLLIVRDLMSRRQRFTPPGPEVRPADQPELFALIERVAQASRVMMPERVYLTGELKTDVFQPKPSVFRQGGYALALGMPLLQILTVSELESLVAHELGYFCGVDLPLSAWVWRTRGAIARSRLPLRLSPLQLLIEGYRWAYQKLTAVVVKQQEFAVDAFAARIAGAKAASSALSNPRMTAYLSYWQQEMSPVQANGFMPPVVSGFVTFLAARPDQTWRRKSKGLSQAESQDSAQLPSIEARLQALQSLDPGEALFAEDQSPAIGLLQEAEETAYQVWMSAGGRVLAPATWEETTYRIFVPRWRELVAAHADLFGGVSADNFDTISREQVMMRVETNYEIAGEAECKTTAERLAACALGVALMDDGWVPMGAPGSPYEFEKDGRRIRPIEEVRELWSGRTQPEQWRERMADYAIGQLELV